MGSWHRDQKNGIGIKRYKNGDVYEGLWLAGRPEGPGMYRWTDGSEYNGEWVSGETQAVRERVRTREPVPESALVFGIHKPGGSLSLSL